MNYELSRKIQQLEIELEIIKELKMLQIDIQEQLPYYEQNGGKRRKTRRRTLNKRK